MTITDTARALARIEIPAGARIPLGAPAQWLLAAVAAGWQCQCRTTGKGLAKDGCGKQHWAYEGHRCANTAAGARAMRLILATDVAGGLRLLCEPCAAGHARNIARQAKTAAAPDPADLGQDSLF